MVHSSSSFLRRLGGAVRPWLGYGLFTVLMFFLFLGLFQCKRSGAGHIMARLGEVARVRAERPELLLFPPQVRMTSLSLQDKEGRFPPVQLRRPVLSLGLAGLFPPRCSVTLDAELGKGAMHVVMESRALTDLKPGAVAFALANAEAEELALEFPGGKVEKGRFSIQGACDLLAGEPSGSATMTLERGDLDLPFPDPALRFVRDVQGRAEVQWHKDQLGLTALSLANDSLSLTGGGMLTIRREGLAGSGLDVRFSLQKRPDSPKLPELYPALARLNANQAITLEVGGTLDQPSARVLQ